MQVFFFFKKKRRKTGQVRLSKETKVLCARVSVETMYCKCVVRRSSFPWEFWYRGQKLNYFSISSLLAICITTDVCPTGFGYSLLIFIKRIMFQPVLWMRVLLLLLTAVIRGTMHVSKGTSTFCWVTFWVSFYRNMLQFSSPSLI